jgi:hypothetical protein
VSPDADRPRRRSGSRSAASLARCLTIGLHSRGWRPGSTGRSCESATGAEARPPTGGAGRKGRFELETQRAETRSPVRRVAAGGDRGDGLRRRLDDDRVRSGAWGGRERQPVGWDIAERTGHRWRVGQPGEPRTRLADAGADARSARERPRSDQPVDQRHQQLAQQFQRRRRVGLGHGRLSAGRRSVWPNAAGREWPRVHGQSTGSAAPPAVGPPFLWALGWTSRQRTSDFSECRQQRC